MPAWTAGESWRFGFEDAGFTATNNWTVLNPTFVLAGDAIAVMISSDETEYSIRWERDVPVMRAIRLSDGAVGRLGLADDSRCKYTHRAEYCEHLSLQGQFGGSFSGLGFPWQTGTTNITRVSGYERTTEIRGDEAISVPGLGALTTVHLHITWTAMNPDPLHTDGFEDIWYSPESQMVVRHSRGGSSQPFAHCVPSALASCQGTVVLRQVSAGTAAPETEAEMAHHLLPPDFLVAGGTDNPTERFPCAPMAVHEFPERRASIFPSFHSGSGSTRIQTSQYPGGEALASFRWTLVDWRGTLILEADGHDLNQTVSVPGAYFLRLEGFDSAGCLVSRDALSFGVGVFDGTDVACEIVSGIVSGTCPALDFQVNPGISDLLANGNPYLGGTATPSPMPGALVILDAEGNEIVRSSSPDAAGIYHLQVPGVVSKGFGTWKLQFVPTVGVATEMEYGISSLTRSDAVPWPTFPDGWTHDGPSRTV